MSRRFATCLTIATVCLACINIGGCGRRAQSSPDDYRPLGLAVPSDDAQMVGLIENARAASTADEAAARWNKALASYVGSPHVFSDGIDNRYYSVAALEMARACYLAQKTAEGDQWLVAALIYNEEPAILGSEIMNLAPTE